MSPKVIPRWYDKPFKSLLDTLEDRAEVSLKPSQSRWQVAILLVTIDVLLISLAVTFLSVYLSLGSGAMNVWAGLAIGFGASGVILLVLILGFLDYLRRHQQDDPILVALKSMDKKLRKLVEPKRNTKTRKTQTSRAKRSVAPKVTKNKEF